MEGSDYETAIDLLERARAQVQHCQNRVPLVVSLVISPNRFSATCRNRLLSLLNRCRDGNLIIFPSQSSSGFVKPYM